MSEVARFTLLGTSEVREGPAMRVGTTEMRSMLFSSENFQAAFSAKVLERGYPCILNTGLNLIFCAQEIINGD